MCWFYLIAAIVTEVLGTTAMKLSEGVTKLVPSVAMFILYGLSLLGMALALKRIEMSVVYAVWSGVGTALIAVIGIIYFKEDVNLVKIASLALIIVGLIGLNLTGSGH